MSTGFVSIQNLHAALDDLRKMAAERDRYETALETIRAMVTDESGHNMQKVGRIANDALTEEEIKVPVNNA